MHPFMKKKKKRILKLFDRIKKNFEVYIPLRGDKTNILVKTVCAKCGYNWSVDEKECFFCKTKYFRAIKCSCGKILPENVVTCPTCKKRIPRTCLKCGKGGKGTFVPITFCSKCGNRQNKFEFKVISF